MSEKQKLEIFSDFVNDCSRLKLILENVEKSKYTIKIEEMKLVMGAVKQKAKELTELIRCNIFDFYILDKEEKRK